MGAAPARSAPAAGAQYDPIAVARFITDANDDNQFAAIADELNLFLTTPVTRNRTSAERAFSLGPQAIGPRSVPAEVLTALRTAFRDDTRSVALQAMYAFGVLAVQPIAADRDAVLRASAPELAGFLGAADPAMRYAALRVIGRVFAKRAGDAAVEPLLSDAVINALNESDGALRVAAMEALGVMREPRAVQGLTQLVEYHGRSREGDAALDALARIAHASSAPLFVAALEGKSTAQRVIAIEGLARIGDAAALPAIQSAADRDGSDAVRLAAAFAGARLGGAGTQPLAEALSRPKLRDQAQAYLVELAPPR